VRARNERSDRIMAGLADPAEVVRLLGLKRRKGGRASCSIAVECPAHDDRKPSLSLRRGRSDGTLAVRCHAAGCRLRGNVFHLLGAVNGLEPGRTEDFKRLLDIGDALIGERPVHVEPARKRTKRDTTPRYPQPGALKTVLRKCRPCASDPEVVAWLSSRGLDAVAVDGSGLAVALPASGGGLPALAHLQTDRGAVAWPKIGARLIVPAYNAKGEVASMRARKITPGGAKVLAPNDCATAGLVIATSGGVAVLRGEENAPRIVAICEGEPDAMTLAMAPANDVAVLGLIGEDSWTPQLGQRLWGREVVLAVDDDRAGDVYASQIVKTIAGHCIVRDMFADGRAARLSRIPWPSGRDLNDLHIAGVDVLARALGADVVMTPETAPFLAPEPAQDAPTEKKATEAPVPAPKAVQEAVARALARIQAPDFDDLTEPQYAVLNVLIQRSWWRRETGPLGQELGDCFPATSTLARDARISKPTAISAYRFLVNRGLLEVRQRVNDDRTRDISNLYRLCRMLVEAGLGTTG
jgi:hypothetical protein